MGELELSFSRFRRMKGPQGEAALSHLACSDDGGQAEGAIERGAATNYPKRREEEREAAQNGREGNVGQDSGRG
eukprot:4182720-Pleurochrysis_carterae.AAC.1